MILRNASMRAWTHATLPLTGHHDRLIGIGVPVITERLASDEKNWHLGALGLLRVTLGWFMLQSKARLSLDLKSATRVFSS